MKVDWLIVGAGFTGSVLAERIATQLNQRVLVVDRRNHIAGNAYDFYDDHGILVHKYGPHIFHTNSTPIWEYLLQFTEWRPYYHKVLASVEGKMVPVPFNLNSLAALFPSSMAAKLESSLIEKYGFGVKVPILRMLEESDPELKTLAKYIYKYVFQGYTEKQWGVPPEQLDASVTGRVPVFVSKDDRYFQDTYQGLPKHGYTEVFRRMLNHPNISILLQTDYRSLVDMIDYKRMIFTGPMDEFFDGCHGLLPYRSLRFELKHEPDIQVQEVAQLNYPNEHSFTRTTEFKTLTGQRSAGSTIAYEYSEPHIAGANEPYYPIPQEQNRIRYASYLDEAARLGDRILFAGRLADYKYYNMDQAIGRALKLFSQITGQTAPEPVTAQSAAI